MAAARGPTQCKEGCLYVEVKKRVGLAGAGRD
jgi:hypothetical protein